MFTPQRKNRSGWRSRPIGDAQENGNSSAAKTPGFISNGKSVAFAEPVTPHGEHGGELVLRSGEITVDREALLEKIQNELYEYQYNMGLLLIEKKEWSSKYEVLQQALVEAKDADNREREAHVTAISDIEKREDNLRKALGVEKQCVVDLEKALREMRSEYAEIKFTAESKLNEANALVTSIEERSLEVEAKLQAADAKLAEVSRKSAEIERKAHEIESQEISYHRERLSFNAKREAHENIISKHREDLREWERKLQEGEARMDESQKILNKREERANENDALIKQREKDLEQEEKRIDLAKSNLKMKEDDIILKLANLNLKEKEFEATGKRLEMKENDLFALKEKLDERERSEIEKLANEHKIILDAKTHEFELEVNRKRKSLEDELRSKVDEVDKKEAAVNHMEQKLIKKEQALEMKVEKLKGKEKEIELKVKALNDREKSIKPEEEKIEIEKKQLMTDKEELLTLKSDVERIRADLEEQKLKICEEQEKLKVTEEERSEILRLRSELKQEIDNCRRQKELILNEAEDLKQQRLIFERDWEELDVKRVGIENDLKELIEQKQSFEKRKLTEEENIQKEKIATQEYIQRELEALELSKETFEANMEHEKILFSERTQSEKTQLIHDLELRKTELETDMQNKQEEMEKQLLEKQKLFEEEKERELININYLKEAARREMEEMKLERSRLDKDKQELDANQKHIEKHQLEMRKDIDDLVALSKKLKTQREQFITERDRFIGFVDKLKSCSNCGEITHEFMLSDLQPVPEIENVRLAEDYMNDGSQGNLVTSVRKTSEVTTPGVSGSPGSGRTLSLLRYCTSKIFSFSPVKRIEPAVTLSPHGATEDPSKTVGGSVNEAAESSFDNPSDSFDVHRIQSDTEAGTQDIVSDGNIEEVAQDSIQSYSKGDAGGSVLKVVKRGRPRGVNRTRSVKAAVVEEAKAIIEKNENHGETSNRGKRSRVETTSASEQDGDYAQSEGHSFSITAGGPRKRRQKEKVGMPIQAAPAQQRYNFRQRRVAAQGGGESKASSDKTRRGGGSWKVSKCNNNDAAPASSSSSLGVTRENENENGGSTRFGPFEITEEEGEGKKMALSEEVNGTPERAGDEKSEWNMENEDEDDDDDEEEVQPGEASIGKKLWTFLTT